MKLQGLSIVFGLIVIPLVLVLTYYIQLQVDTITLQTAYDTKLLDATHDAMVSFELNTANEDLSSVADSLRSIIDASNNIFINTLATNMGLSNASKSYMEPYIPAILYTLYDGYYINSPTHVPEIGVDENGVALEIAENSAEAGYFSIPGLEYVSASDEYIYVPVVANADGTYPAGSFKELSGVPDEDFGELLYKKENGNYTTNINHPDISYKTENVLKTYMPYSARYVYTTASGITKDITINYTLDNYLTIVADLGDGNEKYTKSGYLIRQNLVTSVKADGIDLPYYNENDAEDFIKKNGYNKITLEIDHDADGTTPSLTIENVDGNNYSKIVKELTYWEQGLNNWPLEIDNLEQQYNIETDATAKANIGIQINDLTALLNDAPQKIQEYEYEKSVIESIIYYVKADIFSEWVYTNLGDLQESHIIENISDELIGETQKGHEEIVYSFEGKNKIIFDSTQDPEKNSSIFMSHKFQVIRNSIQYNLNLAMSIYNEKTSESYDFNMPVISDDEWDKIINNISIVSFMQGLNCGLKTYNNYAIVSSTNNEVTVIPSEIYYVKSTDFNTETGSYHRIDCPKLADELVAVPDKLVSFVSKEVKYDKIYDKNATPSYKYDHKNLACYTCIVDGNYTPQPLDDNTLYAYYVSIGKERYNIYKMNAIKYSEGYKVIYDTEWDANGNLVSTLVSDGTQTGDWQKIKSIQITFGHIKTDNWTESTVRILFNNMPQLLGTPYNLTTNQTIEQTIIVPVSPTASGGDISAAGIISNIVVDTSGVLSTVTNDTVQNAVRSIKVIYK